MSTNQSTEYRSAETKLEIKINSPRKKVWEALLHEIDSWWPVPFRMGGPDCVMILEQKVGGRFYEDWGGNQGLLWSTVSTIKEEETLLMTGDLFKEWGGPARLLGGYKLRDDGDGTILRYNETISGHYPDSIPDDIQKGWEFLLEGCFKAYCEGTEPPEWQE